MFPFSVATIVQRLQQPEQNGQRVNDLHPRHKHLLIKRSQRCRVSHNNVLECLYSLRIRAIKDVIRQYQTRSDKIKTIGKNLTCLITFSLHQLKNTTTTTMICDLITTVQYHNWELLYETKQKPILKTLYMVDQAIQD